MSQCLKYFMDGQKGLVILSGIPASGKSYLAKKMNQRFLSDSIRSKVFSTDNLEAFISKNSKFSIEDIKKICSSKDWDQIFQKFQLDKQNFDQKAWNLSRKIIQSQQILDILLQSCQILIIEDELALRSQRKPFKKYCFQKKIKYLEVQIQVRIQEAFSNNQERGKISPTSKVSEQVIKKSFQKYEKNEDSIVLNRKRINQFLELSDIYSCMKYAQIQDNYSEYLLKKAVHHQLTQKEFDENQLRKLISLIMKDQKESQKYFKNPILNKEKASILTQAKKSYIDLKRKVPFVKILREIIQKKAQNTHK